MLPTDAKERKAIPVYSGFIKYFPDAIAEVTKVSKRGNDQHNPGKPLHWDRTKSGDELDALARHLLDSTNPAATTDELIEEAAARTWRSLADLQKLCEQREAETPVSPTGDYCEPTPVTRELDRSNPGYMPRFLENRDQ